MTIQAYDKDFNNGTSFVRQNNLGTAYTAPDTDKPIAVSSNSLTLDANLNYTFSSLTYFDVKANLSYFINTIAGTGTGGYSASEDNNPATNAQLNRPNGVATDSSGNVYIADSYNHRIRKVTASTGIITTIAGTGIAGYTSSEDNNPATNAKLNTPFGLTIDSSGNVYIADSYNHRIRKVTASTGIITTIVGTVTQGYTASEDNNPATNAKLNYPYGVAMDSSGNVYIADYGNNRIRKVTASTGIITTIVGTVTQGYTASEDNNPATNAKLNYPYGVATDSSGNVYIADRFNSRIRKVTASTGIITTIAGTGISEYTASEDNNPATNAKLYYPTGVATDSLGNVYIADFNNNRIRKITASTGIITTVAGTGTAGYTSSEDNNPATNAKLEIPSGVATDLSGNVYIADYGNNRIRKLY